MCVVREREAYGIKTETIAQSCMYPKIVQVQAIFVLALRSSMILYTNMRRNVSEHCKLFAMDYCWDNYYREFIKRLLCGPKRLTIQIQYIHVHRDNVKKKKTCANQHS